MKLVRVCLDYGSKPALPIEDPVPSVKAAGTESSMTLDDTMRGVQEMIDETRFWDIPAIPEVQLPAAPCTMRPARRETSIGRYSVGASACIGAIRLRKTTAPQDRQPSTKTDASMIGALGGARARVALLADEETIAELRRHPLMERLIPMLDGDRSLQEILEAGDWQSSQVLEALFGLLEAGLLGWSGE